MIVLFFLAGIFFYVLTFFGSSCKEKKAANPLTDNTPNTYVGPEACQSCHAAEYEDWKKSDHFRSMEVANDSTVEGNFNDATYTADGVTSHFFHHDGKYFINTQGPDGKNNDYEIKYTFGYFPLQQYLVEFPGGRMQVPRASYDVKQQQWFHQYAGEKIDHNDWLHWSHGAQNWNTMCASCHSTNLQKKYVADSDVYHTTYSVINVSCESCHGPGQKHIDYVQSNNYADGKKVVGSYLSLYTNQTNKEQLAACMPCHARRMEVAPDYIASHEVLDNFIPQVPTDENYYADGQIKDEDYEYGSFTQSKMYNRGVKCSNCHNPHTGNILFTGNALCLQCHEKKYDLPAHYFHAVNSEGSQCINCHMPAHAYMEIDMRRDHSIRVPRPDLSVQYGTPNACNDCHTDKSYQWAADAVVKWYGPERKKNYVDDLIPGSMLDENAVAHLIKMLGDTATPGIIRATSVNYLGNIGDEKSFQAIRQCLLDSDALVRYQAVTAISNFSPQRWVAGVANLLKDSVRAVRINAANMLSGLPDSVFNTNHVSAFSSAHNELMKFLNYQSDFSSGDMLLGDYYYRVGDYANAEKFYLRSLKMDSMINYSRLNLSSIYDAQGKTGEALSILLQAYRTDVNNPRVCYNLALLYAELNNSIDALKFFEKAMALQYDYDRLYYNYGLFLQQQKEPGKAEKIFLGGLKRFPDSENLNYVIAYFYLQTGRQPLAIPFIKKLKEMDPHNPQYQTLFSLLN